MERPSPRAPVPTSMRILSSVKKCHEDGFKFINAALTADEEGNPDISLYSKGIAEFRRGLRQKVSGEGEHQAKTRRLQEKMKRAVDNVEQRMRELRAVDRSAPESTSRQRVNVTKNVAVIRNVTVNKTVTVNRDRVSIKNLKLAGVDNKLVERILDEILEPAGKLTMDNVIGHSEAKNALREMILLPALRPDLFTGLRAPPKGLLLYGPPGNGKTLLAKALADEMPNTKFLNISASSLTSKWVGDGEKMVRALFSVARAIQPCIIFMDEVDSLLTARSESESDSLRRLKTEFLVQFDGAATSNDDRVTVIAATNLPQRLDEAVLRRFPKRIMIVAPDEQARYDLLIQCLTDVKHSLSKTDLKRLAKSTQNYSGSDLTQLAKEAALAPLRELTTDQVNRIKQFRPITLADFVDSMSRIRPSTSAAAVQELLDWTKNYGAIS